MNTLVTGIIIALISIVFVNIVLFGFLGLSLKAVSLGTVLSIQAVVALFLLFMYMITKKKF